MKVFVCVCLLAAACGDDSHSANPDAAVDAAPSIDAPVADADHGQATDAYPAFTVDMPTLRNLGGSVVANPTLVTVTWSTDTNAATFEAMSDHLGASSYWAALNSEYGVGPTTSVIADHVSITTAPPSTASDTDLKTFITTNAGSGSSGWPAPTASTLYLVYTAPSTAITFSGQNACNLYGGYHDQATANGITFPFVVVFGCSNTTASAATTTASSLLDSAATDPLPMSSPAYAAFDNDHLSWAVLTFFADETGLACQGFQSSFYTETETNFMFGVQRGWSNASAHAGHNPCVPVPASPYFNVTPFPAEQDMISTTILGQATPTRGYKGVVGQKRAFSVGFYSDQGTAPIRLSARAPTNLPNGGANGTAMIDIDKTMGSNGEKALVTVTPTTFNQQGIILVVFTTTLGADSSFMPILIGQ